MLRRMLGVDSWLDVASLENVEEKHSFLFLKIFFFFEKVWKSWIFQGIENFDWFFFFFEKFGSLEFFHGIENFDWWFFFFFLIWKSWIFQGIENFDWFFFFLKYEYLFVIKKWRRWRWRCSKSEEDLFMMIFFFFWKNLSFEWE